MSRTFITGDLHSSPGAIARTVAQIDNPKEDDKIIICGDAGFEYMSYISGAAKKAAKRFPGSWIVLRGNHDSRYWEEHCNPQGTPKEGWSYTDDRKYLYQKKYPNIFYVSDAGGLYTINDLNFLFIPGAYSVDRDYRLKHGFPWNPQEQLTEKERDNLISLVKKCNKENIAIDFVIGHTFPCQIEPYYQHLFLDFIDQSTVDKTMENFLGELSSYFEQNFAFKHYFGGHFHSNIRLTEKYTMLYDEIADIKHYLKEN